jgi:hypothetical protein
MTRSVRDVERTYVTTAGPLAMKDRVGRRSGGIAEEWRQIHEPLFAAARTCPHQIAVPVNETLKRRQIQHILHGLLCPDGPDAAGGPPAPRTRT